MVNPVIYVGLQVPTQKKIMGDVNLCLSSHEQLSTRVRDAIVKICFYFEISPSELKSLKRSQNLVQARCILCNYLKHHTHFTLKRIGQIIGKRNYSTVIYNLNLYDDLFKFNKEFQQTVKNIKL